MTTGLTTVLNEQTVCSTRLSNRVTVLNEQPLFFQPVVKLGCTTGLTTGCIGLHDTAVCQTVCQTGLTSGSTNFGVQFVGLGHCTKQNTDGIRSFVHCSLLCNGNHHTLHQKIGVVRPNFGESGPPRPPVVAPLIFKIWEDNLH